MSAGFKIKYIVMENCGERRRSELYKKDVLEIIWRQVLVVRHEEVFIVVLNLEAEMEMEFNFILKTSIGLKMLRDRL